MLANMAQHEGPHTCSILLFGCYAIFAAAPEATGSKAGSKGTVFSIMGAPVAPVPGGLRPAENRLRPERSSSPSTIFDGSWGERFRYSAGGGLPLHPHLYPEHWVTRTYVGSPTLGGRQGRKPREHGLLVGSLVGVQKPRSAVGCCATRHQPHEALTGVDSMRAH